MPHFNRIFFLFKTDGGHGGGQFVATHATHGRAKIPEPTTHGVLGMSTSMDQLIKLVNRLQDAFATVNVANAIDLPQIVVIGRYCAADV
jgi:hypothetical protein